MIRWGLKRLEYGPGGVDLSSLFQKSPAMGTPGWGLTVVIRLNGAACSEGAKSTPQSERCECSSLP